MIPYSQAVTTSGCDRKLYAKIVNNPKDVRFEDLDKILKKYGFECRQPSKGSSHYNYYHPRLPDILTIPYARPIKAIYVKQVIEAIGKLREGSE
ncbi:MAG: type II toxin-antitoxin system HicA family toxin [Firmicutes bacterium]|nr:type II toxin-antitoxin system HicA family toxin [Bacillota bacterium]